MSFADCNEFLLVIEFVMFDAVVQVILIDFPFKVQGITTACHLRMCFDLKFLLSFISAFLFLRRIAFSFLKCFLYRLSMFLIQILNGRVYLIFRQQFRFGIVIFIRRLERGLNPIAIIEILTVIHHGFLYVRLKKASLIGELLKSHLGYRLT